MTRQRPCSRPESNRHVLAYRDVVAKRLRVLTKRENAATAREGLHRLLARGRIVLRPNLTRAQPKVSALEHYTALDSNNPRLNPTGQRPACVTWL